MGLMNVNDELEGFKGLPVSLRHSPKQRKYLSRDITITDEKVLWSELGELKNTALISFREMGRRLKELHFRYSKNGNGDFEKRYTELGFKKMEVYTLMKKYDQYLLDATKESLFLTPPETKEDNNNNDVLEGEIVEGEIVRTADNQKVEQRLDGASQRTVAELSKSPPEVREKFYSGEINSAPEIKKAREKFTAGKIIKPAVIKDDRRQARVEELSKELKDIDREIADLLEAERKLKSLREQRAEVVEELSKVNNLKLDFSEDSVYKNLMAHLEHIKKSGNGSMSFTQISLKDDWWRSRAYEWWQDNQEELDMRWFQFEDKYCK